MVSATLVMMRHGESEWNKMNLFQGWVDIPLSSKGIEESIEAGKKIAQIPFDVIFTSALIRTQVSALMAMTQHQGGKTPMIQPPVEEERKSWTKIYNPEAQSKCIPLVKAWQLNERMYGELQGLNKEETVKKFGAEQVKLWRRSYKIAPPQGESLEMTADRVIAYFKKYIVPYLENGKNVLLVAHGNTLRAIVMYLDQLSEEQVIELEIGTGRTIIYKHTNAKWEKLVS